MKTIWQLSLTPGIHRLPAQTVFLDAQPGAFWALVDDTQPAKDYTLHLVSNGCLLPAGADEDCYLATVGGQHVFVTE